MTLNRDQFVDVFHSSYFEKPPHEMSIHEVMGENKMSPGFTQNNESVNNMDRVIFGGSRRAAQSRISRPFVHKYRIPNEMVRPELWADDMSSKTGSKPFPPTYHHSTPQAELFEMFPADIKDVTPTEVIKYRNDVEDAGSISHIMSKEAIKSGKIKYLGVEPRNSND